MKVPEILAASNSVSTRPVVTDPSNNPVKPQSKSISSDFQRRVNAANSSNSSRSSAASEGDVRAARPDGTTKQARGGRGHALLKGQDAGLERAELQKAMAELSGKDAKAGKASALTNPGNLPDTSAQALKGDASELTNAAKDTQNKGQDSALRNQEAMNQSQLNARNGLSVNAPSFLRGDGSIASQASQPLSGNASNQVQSPQASAANLAASAAQADAAARGVPAGTGVNVSSGVVQTGQPDILSSAQVQGVPAANPTAEAVMLVPFVDISGARTLKRTRQEDHIDAENELVAEAEGQVQESEGVQTSLKVAENGAELVEVTTVGEDEPEDKKVEGSVSGNEEGVELIVEDGLSFDTLSLVQQSIEGTRNTKPTKDQKHWYESTNLNDET